MDRFEKDALSMIVLMWIGVAIIGLAFWGGLIWLVFFLLNKYGVI